MIRFIPISAIIAIHAEMVREFGGQNGLRDRGLLESAIAKARNIHEYEQADIPRMAAAYAFGILKNHPFIDGNKRTGFMTAYAFLQMNGLELHATEEEVVIVMIGVAEGSVDEKMLTTWFKANTKAI